MNEINLKKSPHPQQIKDVFNLISQARRPVIIAGHGIKAEKAEKEFIQLIEQFKIPVLTTWRAMDLIDNNHELFFGRPGLLTSNIARYVEDNADLIICIGARMDLMQTAWKTSNYAPQAIKIIIDIDHTEVTKHNFLNVQIHCNAGVFIRELLNLNNSVYSDWLLNCEKQKNLCNDWRNKKEYNSELIDLYYVVDLLSDLASTDDIIVPSSAGFASEVTQQAWKVKQGQRVICNPGLGSMGFALPHAIGACIASGGKRVICIEGDGSLQHNIQELNTISKLNLNIKIFVINNKGYASIKNTHKKFFNSDPVKDLNLSFRVPRGLSYASVKKYTNMFYRIEELVLKPDCPVICEIFINPNQIKEII